MVAGSAANVARPRRLGTTSTVVSVMGDDSTAMLARDVPRRESISPPTTSPSIKETQSSFSAVLNFEGESTVLAVHHPHRYPSGYVLERCGSSCAMGGEYKTLYRDLPFPRRQRPTHRIESRRHPV